MSKNRGFKLGDLVEFLSDKQTEKGPSSGSIIEIDTDEKSGTQISIVVKHSDCPKEVFHLSHLNVNRKVEREDGKVLWICD
jgi:uncharacterized protein YukJ